MSLKDRVHRAATSAASLMSHAALRYVAEPLEIRRLLYAAIIPPDPIVYADSVTGPLAPRPGHTFYVAGYDAQGVPVSQWANASAITPNTVNDLVLNVTPFATNYQACCEGTGGSAKLLTNGITQTQVGPAPTKGAQPAVGDGGASDPSNNLNVISGAAGSTYFFDYNLGAAAGNTPTPVGYDISEIDVITGHQDQDAKAFNVDVLVEPVNTNQFFSLSASDGFSLTNVIDNHGNPIAIGKGAVQMSLVESAAGPLAMNIRAVRFVSTDPTTVFRELVVTGTQSAGDLTGHSTIHVSAAMGSAGPTVSWDDLPDGHAVQRAPAANGPWTTVGNVYGRTTFTDRTAQTGNSYFYRVIEITFAGTRTSAASAGITVPPYGATAYVFQGPDRLGGPVITEAVPKVDFVGGGRASAYPLGSGIDAGSFSTFVHGKVTTGGAAGAYTFVTNTDDDGYLYVNGQLASADPGAHAARNATTVYPLELEPYTAYDFVFLSSNRGGEWGMHLMWQEPDGRTLPPWVIPAERLSPVADTPPAPTMADAQATGAGRVQLTWDSTGDASSFGYVVQCAPADAAGNPVGPFAVVGEAFSGPATAGAAPPPRWGATSFVDDTAVPNSRYVYRVGAVMPGQAVPYTFGPPTAPVATPPAASASFSSGVLYVNLIGPNDSVRLSTSGTQLLVNEGDGTIFSAPMADVSTLQVSGDGAGSQSLSIDSPLELPGPVTVGLVDRVAVNASLHAAQAMFGDVGVVNVSGMIDVGSLVAPATGVVNFAAGARASIAGAMNAGGVTIGGLAGGAAATVIVGSFDVSSLAVNLTGLLKVTGGSGGTVNATHALTVAPGGQLDLGSASLLVRFAGNADPVHTLRAYLATGSDNGRWDGSDIVSSAARDNPLHNTAIGFADGNDGTGVNPIADSVLLKYAVLGDADLDGTVGLADYTAVIRNFGVGSNWDQGAFTYGSPVGLADYTAVVRNFGQTLVAPAAITTSSASPAAATESAVADPSRAPRRRVGHAIAIVVRPVPAQSPSVHVEGSMRRHD